MPSVKRLKSAESQYFIQPEDEPAWQQVWYGTERTEEEFEAAFRLMESQFAAREFDEPGVVLHLFGLRLLCSEIVQLDLSMAANTRAQ